MEEVWSAVHNAGRKPTAGAQDQRNGDEHRTLASHGPCLQLCRRVWLFYLSFYLQIGYVDM